MVVNSFSFLSFFVVVFAVYYLPITRRHKLYQNTWLLLSSYFFYGFADIAMIPLLLGSTIVFYLLGKYLKKIMVEQRWKVASYLTTLGVSLGVGVLLYFKYLNFFADSFAQILNGIGLNVTWTTLNIVLPIGVSFFTFKLISYIIEIHRERIEPSDNFIEFATYIAFFPTILSGPIDRPNKFLPQLRKSHEFDYSLAVDGCRQILWGCFTKMCIADNLAVVTDNAWVEYSTMEGLTLLVVSFLYFIQMYTDFAGYSNMAIGVSKILGFHVTRNFNHPLLARNTAEYWQRWHMSLTSWITDYVFMPLNIAFRKIGKVGTILAVIINLVIIGLWHGANWTYGIFGLYHGLLFIPLILMGSYGKKKKLKSNILGLPLLNDFFKMILTFFLVSLGLVIFRAPSVFDGYAYMYAIIKNFNPNEFALNIKLSLLLCIVIQILFEWSTRNNEHELECVYNLGLGKFNIIFRWAIYLSLIMIIAIFRGIPTGFIYFQF